MRNTRNPTGRTTDVVIVPVPKCVPEVLSAWQGGLPVLQPSPLPLSLMRP